MVTCATRDGNTLDHCYRSIPRGPCYGLPGAHLQTSAHLQTVVIGCGGVTGCGGGCFEYTDCGVLKEAAADIQEYTESVSDYTTFCEGLCIPTKTIKIYHNKPWFKTTISNTNYRQNKKLTKETTRTNTGRRGMQRRRPSRQPRPITVTSWRRISPPTTPGTSSRV